MSGADCTLSESHLATPKAVGAIRSSITAYAGATGFTGTRLDEIRLAVSEAVSNVVMHAYRGEPGKVRVTARVVDGALWVLIADDGVGNNIPTSRPGLGWGLALITDACDEFTLADRPEGGTEARMRFLIPAYPQNVTREDQ